MNVSQSLQDIQYFIANDPLLAAAAALTVPASTRQVLADHLVAVANDVAKVVEDATSGLEPSAP